MERRAGYIGDQREVFAYAKNLFDKNYITRQVTDPATGDVDRVRVDDPLTIGVIGKYYF